MTCRHKIPRDFQTGTVINGRIQWLCSRCGKPFFWNEKSAWEGRVECPTCWFPEIESVWCGECDRRQTLELVEEGR